MKILALSDIHNEIPLVDKLLWNIAKKDIDLIIICGDITNYGPKDYAERILDKLSFTRVLAIPGNLDLNEIATLLDTRSISLHNKKIKLNGFNFVGYGGGLLGNVGVILNMEEKVKRDLAKLVDNKTILVTHLPPINSLLDNVNGKHIGSKAVREIIESKKPFLHLCGHAHESANEEKIKETTSINVGALKDGTASLVEIDDKKNISCKRLKF
ncbi:MAG: metallophosphoesterase [archaeon]